MKVKIGKDEACLDGKFVRFYRGEKFIWGLKYKTEASARKAFTWFRKKGREADNEIKKRIRFGQRLNG